MSDAWTHTEDAVLHAVAERVGPTCFLGMRFALKRAGFARSVMDIRDRLLDLELLPLAVRKAG